MQSRDIQYEITTPIQKLAVELYKTATITDNKGWHTNGQLDDVDWNEWFISSATMPLTGPGFVAHWEKLAEVAIKFVKVSDAASANYLYVMDVPNPMIPDSEASDGGWRWEHVLSYKSAQTIYEQLGGTCPNGDAVLTALTRNDQAMVFGGLEENNLGNIGISSSMR